MPFRSRTAAPGQTEGLSPKTVLAFAFPFVASVGGALSQYVGTGHLDTTSIRVAGAGLILSVVSALGAWLGNPGKIKQADPVT